MLGSQSELFKKGFGGVTGGGLLKPTHAIPNVLCFLFVDQIEALSYNSSTMSACLPATMFPAIMVMDSSYKTVSKLLIKCFLF